MSNPLSPFFENMVKIGLPHYGDDENCWCNPTVIYLQIDWRAGAVQNMIIFHKYGVPLTNVEIHAVFKEVLIQSRDEDKDNY